MFGARVGFSGGFRRRAGACCDECAEGLACAGGGGCGTAPLADCPTGVCNLAATDVRPGLEPRLSPEKASGFYARDGRAPSAVGRAVARAAGYPMGRASGYPIGSAPGDLWPSANAAFSTFLSDTRRTRAQWFALGSANQNRAKRDAFAPWARGQALDAAQRDEVFNAFVAMQPDTATPTSGSTPGRVTVMDQVAVAGGGIPTPGGARFGLTEAEWNSLNATQREAWARGFAEREGLPPAEAARLASEARTADYALIRGLVTEGMSTIRSLLEANSRERVEEIRANAAIAAARITGDREAETRILNALRQGSYTGQTGGMTTTGGTGKKSGRGAAMGLIGLALLLAK